MTTLERILLLYGSAGNFKPIETFTANKYHSYAEFNPMAFHATFNYAKNVNQSM